VVAISKEFDSKIVKENQKTPTLIPLQTSFVCKNTKQKAVNHPKFIHSLTPAK